MTSSRAQALAHVARILAGLRGEPIQCRRCGRKLPLLAIYPHEANCDAAAEPNPQGTA